MNANILLPVAMTAFAGAAVAAQPAFNGQLAAFLGSPFRAALASFTAGAGTMALVVIAGGLRNGFPAVETLARVPAHLWVAGGMLGALFVSTATWAAPKIGVGAFFSTLIAAQLIAALAMDHFAMFGLEHRPATLMRFLGVALLVAGAWLMVEN